MIAPSPTKSNNQKQENHDFKEQFALKVKFLAQTRGISWHKLINQLISLHNQHKNIYPRQRALGTWTGCSMRSINRYCAELVQEGLLIMSNRPGTTNVYYLHPLFWDKDIRGWLKATLNKLVYFPIAWILSLSAMAPISCQQKHFYLGFGVPLYYSKDLFIDSGSLVSCLVEGSVVCSCKCAHTREKNHQPTDRNLFTTIKRCDKMNENVKSTQLSQGKRVSYFKRLTPKYPEFLDNTPLNLTEAGKVTLAQYPDDALRHALAELKRSTPKEDPIMWLHKVCRSWCKEHTVWPDVAWVESQYDYHEWDASSMLIDPTQPYKKVQSTTQQPQKETHFRKLDPEEIEPLKKKYKHAVNAAMYAHETYEHTPTQVNKSAIHAQEQIRDEIRDLLRYNEIDYEPQPFNRSEGLDEAMVNIQRARQSPGYKYLVQALEAQGLDFMEIERGILERAEKNDKDKRGSIHPLLR